MIETITLNFHTLIAVAYAILIVAAIIFQRGRVGYTCLALVIGLVTSYFFIEGIVTMNVAEEMRQLAQKDYDHISYDTVGTETLIASPNIEIRTDVNYYGAWRRQNPFSGVQQLPFEVPDFDGQLTQIGFDSTPLDGFLRQIVYNNAYLIQTGTEVDLHVILVNRNLVNPEDLFDLAMQIHYRWASEMSFHHAVVVVLTDLENVYGLEAFAAVPGTNGRLWDTIRSIPNGSLSDFLGNLAPRAVAQGEVSYEGEEGSIIGGVQVFAPEPNEYLELYSELGIEFPGITLTISVIVAAIFIGFFALTFASVYTFGEF